MSLPTEPGREYLLKKYLEQCGKYVGVFCEDARSNTGSEEIPTVHQRVQGDKAKGAQMKRGYEKSGESSRSVGNTEASCKIPTLSLLKRWERGERVKLLTIQGDKSAGFITFYNYKGLSFVGIRDELNNSGATFSFVKVYDNHYVRVGMKREEDVRLAYNYLKKDPKYKVGVLFDKKDAQQVMKLNALTLKED